ncbi:helix-turn-helix domain-containing protein [Bdellovibrio sp. HCB185ZH]|uniref:helix-turn-helix domain-containing protein n=1 Tax=Bdellovibrio sp. HCB185ZH TaxID=3394235 RepID=UPI0039A54C5F
MPIGTFLKSKRQNAHLTQQEAAELLGYDKPQFLSNIERGKRTPPCDLLKRMCSLYHVDENEMLEQYIETRKRRATLSAIKIWDKAGDQK